MPRERMTPVALTIAGSDPSGGAGLQADLKTFHQHGAYGMSVVTLLTVQNTQTVSAVQVLPAPFVLDQLSAVLQDIPPTAAKTGALGDSAVIETLAGVVADFRFPLVIDPVMISKHGAALIDPSAARLLVEQLLPHATLITPNLHEAAAITGRRVETLDEMEQAARAIVDLGAGSVLVKGGHLEGQAIDVLFHANQLHRFPAERHPTQHTHGTGCVLSASITARLARGQRLLEAVAGAKSFVEAAIRTNPGLGEGCGPTNLFAPVD